MGSKTSIDTAADGFTDAVLGEVAACPTIRGSSQSDPRIPHQARLTVGQGPVPSNNYVAPVDLARSRRESGPNRARPSRESCQSRTSVRPDRGPRMEWPVLALLGPIDSTTRLSAVGQSCAFVDARLAAGRRRQQKLSSIPEAHRFREGRATSQNLPLLTSRTSSFHSACDSRTVFASSPIVTPWSVISTSGQAAQG